MFLPAIAIVAILVLAGAVLAAFAIVYQKVSNAIGSSDLSWNEPIGAQRMPAKKARKHSAGCIVCQDSELSIDDALARIELERRYYAPEVSDSID